MRKLLLVLFVFSLLFTGCEEVRTTIELKDFYNNSANDAYVAISKSLFFPGNDTSMQLSTTTVSSGAVADIVLLDTDSLDSNAYYIYMALDIDGGGISLSNDYIMPIPRVKVEDGDEVVLQGIEASTSHAMLYSPSTWGNNGIARIMISNDLNTSVSNYTPVNLVIRSTQVFSNTSLANDEGYLRLSDDAVVEVAYFYQPYMNVYVCLFMDLNTSDTSQPFMPTSGDYAAHSYAAASYNITQYVDIEDYDYNHLNETLSNGVTILP